MVKHEKTSDFSASGQNAQVNADVCGETIATNWAAVANKSSALHRDNAFGRLPMEVARDTRLSVVEFVVLTHRTTFTKGFVPKEHIVQGIVKGGLGKDTVRRAIARLRSEESPQAKRKRERGKQQDIEPELLGYINRSQEVDKGGLFVKAREELCLPKCRRPRLVPRTWFDGHLSLNALATLIYIQAGTEGGGRPYPREIAERFGWTRQTAVNAVRELVEKGRVKEHHDRSQGGRFAGTRYGLENPRTVDFNRVKKTGNGATGNGQPGNILRDSLYELSSRDSSNKCIRSSYASRQNSEDAETIDHRELLSDAFCSQSLLGWIEDKPIQEDFFSIDEDAIHAISEVAGEKELLDLLRKATGGRVSSEIMSSAGIAAVRQIAAHVLEQPPYGESFEPHEALDYVLNAINVCIGSQPGKWLNSLAVFGLRILWPASFGDGVEEAPYSSQRPRRTTPAPRMTAELRTLKKALGSHVIAPKLYRDPDGLKELLRKYGPDALNTIRTWLVSAVIDGGKVGKIKSWDYFVGALEDERRAAELKAQGMRPGDCPGWRHGRRE